MKECEWRSFQSVDLNFSASVQLKGSNTPKSHRHAGCVSLSGHPHQRWCGHFSMQLSVKTQMHWLIPHSEEEARLKRPDKGERIWEIYKEEEMVMMSTQGMTDVQVNKEFGNEANKWLLRSTN